MGVSNGPMDRNGSAAANGQAPSQPPGTGSSYNDAVRLDSSDSDGPGAGGGSGSVNNGSNGSKGNKGKGKGRRGTNPMMDDDSSCDEGSWYVEYHHTLGT